MVVEIRHVFKDGWTRLSAFPTKEWDTTPISSELKQLGIFSFSGSEGRFP